MKPETTDNEDARPRGEDERPKWHPKQAFFVPVLGAVETVQHHYWVDVHDWRHYRHGEAHIAAEGYNV